MTLYDKETGTTLGEISPAQLQFMFDQLEEESADDQDYYLNVPTLDMLAESGADPALLETLRRALGDREEMEVRWSEA